MRPPKIGCSNHDFESLYRKWSGQRHKSGERNLKTAIKMRPASKQLVGDDVPPEPSPKRRNP